MQIRCSRKNERFETKLMYKRGKQESKSIEKYEREREDRTGRTSGIWSIQTRGEVCELLKGF